MERVSDMGKRESAVEALLADLDEEKLWECVVAF